MKYGAKYVSLKTDDPYTITLERALEVIREKQIADANRLILDFPDAGIQVLNGRYGPYITDKTRNAKIPKDRDPKSLTLAECQALLAAAPARAFGKWGRKNAKGAPKAAAPKAAAPKAAAAGREPKAAPQRLAAKELKAAAKKRAPASTAARAKLKPKAKKKSSGEKEILGSWLTRTATAPVSRTADASAVQRYLRELHDRITAAVEALDTAKFRRDCWQRPEGGGGESRVLTRRRGIRASGSVFFTCTWAARCRSRHRTCARKSPARAFEAMGISLVFHPRNPYAPTTHCNVRFLVAAPQSAPAVWWFGGGFDLTPYYPFDEDVLHWHRTARAACQPFGAGVYEKYKQWCDRYFFLPHRNETRGVGGLFFDDLNEGGFAHCFGLTRSVGDHFLPAYMPIVERRRSRPWGERERNFQLYRRGRYVEFNLLYDRGTLFGLQSRGRTESILMSMPPLARWEYDWRPDAGSPEARLYEDFLRPRDYLAELAG